MHVASAEGEGTTFDVGLPRVTEDVRPESAPAGRAAPPPGSGTVLVVEDEEPLREIVREILETGGYTVIAGEAEEALARAQAHPGEIALLLTDVVMPGASGREVAQRLARFQPKARVLFMSGYTDEALGRQGVLDSAVHLLLKPFTASALLWKVREVLEAPGPGA